MSSLLLQLQQKTSLSKKVIQNILNLLEDGSTIPFIARYRKDLTDGATDEVLRNFEDVYETLKKLQARKEEIKNIIAQRATLTTELQKAIDNAKTLTEVEDIYLPFKEQKNTRASVAIAKGLEPLAKKIQSAKITQKELLAYAKKFLNSEVKTIQEAIDGAKDIIAQEYAQDKREREYIRQTMQRYGILEVKRTKKFQENGLYKNITNQKVASVASHRYLAMMRGVKEKELSVKIVIDKQRVLDNIEKYKIPRYATDTKEFLPQAYKDGLNRLLLPSVENEIHSFLKEKADKEAIELFGKNLRQLLLTPALQNKAILGVDPGFVSGCKIALVDKEGNYVDSAVIYPTPPKNDFEGAKKIVLEFVKKYQIDGVTIGNGTASKETEEFFAKLNQEVKLPYTIVSEAGASVYSASKIAQEEYPNLDVTIRGAISIASRLQDPMAEFVKIDPKSLGIGQYQHDVNQKLLAKKLHDTTIDLVNYVGVDINKASASLLGYVAGVTKSVAKNIVAHREQNGPFQTKKDLLKVKGVGVKLFEQAAGFIRIKNAKNILDNSGIHPESYTIAQALLKKDLKNIDVQKTALELNVGQQTLRDIIKELQRPGFDPRQELPKIPFKQELRDIDALQVGMVVSGIIRNITDFGAFVDIGLKNDALLHISKISQQRIAHPLEVLSLNQYLPQIEIIGIENGKISLGLT